MSWQHSRLISVIVAVIGLALGSETANAQTNYLRDLGAVAPGRGINNSGQVVLENYFYSDGTLTALPNGFIGNAINASGHIAGVYGIYYYGTVTALPTPSDDYFLPNFSAVAINDSGAVLINYYVNITDVLSDLYSDRTLTGISAGCGGNVLAEAINDSGQITGTACDLGYGDVFIEDATTTATTDLGIRGYGNAINASGEVTGIHYTIIGGPSPSVTAAAFLYSHGKVTLLPATLGPSNGRSGCEGNAINASGFIVGSCAATIAGEPYGCDLIVGNCAATAFLYNGVTDDLNTLVMPSDPLKPYVTLTDARGINDSGLVIVNGTDSRDKSSHAYLLQLPLIKVTPGPLSFTGRVQPVGTTSAPQSVTFSNAGTASLALGVPSSSDQFSIVSNTCGAALAPGAGCAVGVSFKPTVAGPPIAGAPTGALTLVVGGVPISVPLLGVTPLTLTLTASAPATLDRVTLTWKTSVPATCTETGGGNGAEETGWTAGFILPIGTNGMSSVFEGTNGTYTYGMTCNTDVTVVNGTIVLAAGSQTTQAQTSVYFGALPVTTSISASPTTVNASKATTLTWTSANAASCVGHGGGTGDGWANNGRPTSGSVPVTEPKPPTAGSSETLTFSITCTSSVSKLSATASVKVVQNGPSSSGGGGAFDSLSLIFLLALRGLHQLRRNGVLLPPACSRRCRRC